jgi:hypothetical protein
MKTLILLLMVVPLTMLGTEAPRGLKPIKEREKEQVKPDEKKRTLKSEVLFNASAAHVKSRLIELCATRGIEILGETTSTLTVRRIPQNFTASFKMSLLYGQNAWVKITYTILPTAKGCKVIPNMVVINSSGYGESVYPATAEDKEYLVENLESIRGQLEK